MPHVDEGTLHALLDGELGAAEVLEVQTHFATCAACAARLDEARHLLAETERLVIALEPPAGAAARAPRMVVGRPMIPLDPVVLIPDNPTATEVRRSRFKIMGWAAGFLVVVGAGFLGLEMRHAFSGAPRAGSLRIRPEDFTFIHTKAEDSTPAAPANPPAANANPARTQNAPPAPA
jgi:anti-sigma factor RsiW